MLEEKCKIGGHNRRRRDYASDKKKLEAEQRLLLRTAQNLICSPSRTRFDPKIPQNIALGVGAALQPACTAETASQQFSGQNGRTDVQVRLA